MKWQFLPFPNLSSKKAKPVFGLLSYLWVQFVLLVSAIVVAHQVHEFSMFYYVLSLDTIQI